jgi:hypothetical protein
MIISSVFSTCCRNDNYLLVQKRTDNVALLYFYRIFIHCWSLLLNRKAGVLPNSDWLLLGPSTEEVGVEPKGDVVLIGVTPNTLVVVHDADVVLIGVTPKTLVVVHDTDVVLIGAAPNENVPVVVDDADVVWICWNPLLNPPNWNPVAACCGVIKLWEADALGCTLEATTGCITAGFGSDKSYIHFYLEELQTRETHVAFVVLVVVVLLRWQGETSMLQSRN